MIKTMIAIEYNVLMTILKFLGDMMPIISMDYGMNGVNVQILPAYPADLTSLKKPSIIVRKVDTRQSKVGIGNVLGQYFNNDENRYYDIVGKMHEIMIQIDVVSSNSAMRALLESMVADGILNHTAYTNGGKIILYDFTVNEKAPTQIGCIKLISDPMVRDLYDDKSTDMNYIGIIRHKLSVVQTIVPKQEYVDLSRWVKQTYKIIL